MELFRQYRENVPVERRTNAGCKREREKQQQKLWQSTTLETRHRRCTQKLVKINQHNSQIERVLKCLSSGSL